MKTKLKKVSYDFSEEKLDEMVLYEAEGGTGTNCGYKCYGSNVGNNCGNCCGNGCGNSNNK